MLRAIQFKGCVMLQLLKSKTVWFSIILAVLPLFAQFIGVFNLTPIQQMVALQVIAVVTLLLRLVTTKPVSEL